MEKRELICIGCPMGCPMTVTMENGEVLSVSGNTCKRGDVYARKEVTNPTPHCHQHRDRGGRRRRDRQRQDGIGRAEGEDI